LHVAAAAAAALPLSAVAAASPISAVAASPAAARLFSALPAAAAAGAVLLRAVVQLTLGWTALAQLLAVAAHPLALV
jgi:hypothetical protein